MRNFLFTAGINCLLSSAVLAQEVNEKTSDSLGSLMAKGGGTLWVIAGLSVIATFLVVFYLLTLRSGMLYPKQFMLEAESTAEEGDFEALQALCIKKDSAAAVILASAADQALASNKPDYKLIRSAIEDEGARQAGKLWQRIQYLLDIGVIAPMVGLLGTVLGMLTAFAELESQDIGVKQQALAQGIAQALITTAAGLCVGIFAMILYSFFRGRVNALIAGMENACNRVLRKGMNKIESN